jgi:hypothetical protein
MISALSMYFVGSLFATMAGFIFLMTVENLNAGTSTPSIWKHIGAAALLSVVFTPLGAWLITVVIRLRRLRPLS